MTDRRPMFTRVPRPVHARVREAARSRGVPMTTWVEAAVRVALEREASGDMAPLNRGLRQLAKVKD